MPIKISQIEADSLGPLPTFKGDLADITLIYGHNETGKTFLVELILQSLFKNLAGFKGEFRIKRPKGKVTVTGLENELVNFSPTSRNKLDTIWAAVGHEMPSNIARLLVVKGGEIEIDKDTDTGGISHNIVREFLSSQGILNSIQKNIRLKSTKDAKIESGEILGSATGDIGKRSEIFEEISNINRLLERVNLELADGDIVGLNKQMARAMADINNIETARKYEAFQISQEITREEDRIHRFEEADFPALDNNFNDFQRKKAFLQKKMNEREMAERRGEHYSWLNEAIEDYQKHFGQIPVSVSNTFLIVAGAFLLTAIALVTFNQSWPAIAAIIVAIGTGFWHFQQAKRSHIGQAQQNEIERIRATYQEKFNEPCNDLPTMRANLEVIASAYHAAQQFGKEIGEVKEEINDLESKIRYGLNALDKDNLSTDAWDQVLTDLRREFINLQHERQTLETDLARYDVHPSDYVKESPGVIYHRETYEKAQTEKGKLERELGNLERSLLNLKSEIQGVIGNHYMADWGELLHSLRELKLEKVKQFQILTTDIVAGNLLNQVIEQNREREDEKIRENLESETVKRPLLRITKDYIGFEIEEESLKIIDKYDQRFDLKDLSTGTREQILLALRIGFASKVMRDDAAFLILDDAFQHSDWERRPRLVDTIFEIAKEGWQIIYFTMDDNIRDLFTEKGQNAGKDSYAMIEL